MAKHTERYTEGFDVTCTIGHVSFDDTGDTPAHVAAFMLIAQHDCEGRFHFPMHDGRMCVVEVHFDEV